jgi:hypothetical protein
MLRSIMRDIAAFDIVHRRVRMPLPWSIHGLAFLPLLGMVSFAADAAFVTFAEVARRGVDVVRLPLAMMDSPVRSVAVRPGGMFRASCRAAYWPSASLGKSVLPYY